MLLWKFHETLALKVDLQRVCQHTHFIAEGDRKTPSLSAIYPLFISTAEVGVNHLRVLADAFCHSV